MHPYCESNMLKDDGTYGECDQLAKYLITYNLPKDLLGEYTNPLTANLCEDHFDSIKEDNSFETLDVVTFGQGAPSE